MGYVSASAAAAGTLAHAVSGVTPGRRCGAAARAAGAKLALHTLSAQR